MRRALALAVLLAGGPAAAMPYRFGLSQAQCGWAGGCYVTAYFDLNRNSGALRDWACGTHTYDNHTGTDYGIGGFTGMDQGRDVFAAAAGTVIGAHDGEFDRCTSGACGTANYVWIKHADGQVSLYYHLKKNSVAVSVGQQVTCGQKLGQVGSSGYSTGPHFHFQVNTRQGDSNSFDDPYAGTNATCGGPYSWWVSQGGYKGLPGFACPVPPQPDLVVTAVTLSPANPLEGAAVTFSATVKNQGTAGTGAAVRVAFSVDGNKVSWGSASALAAGATATITASGGAAGPTWQAVRGTHAVLAAADDLGAIAESNEGNNGKPLAATVGLAPATPVLAEEPPPPSAQGMLSPAPAAELVPGGPGPLLAAEVEEPVEKEVAGGPETVVGGCGCGSGTAPGLLGLLGLAARARRRRSPKGRGG